MPSRKHQIHTHVSHFGLWTFAYGYAKTQRPKPVPENTLIMSNDGMEDGVKNKKLGNPKPGLFVFLKNELRNLYMLLLL